MIRSVQMWQAVCDGCGRADDTGTFSAWANPDDAIKSVVSEESWLHVMPGDLLYCNDCQVYDEAADEYVAKERP